MKIIITCLLWIPLISNIFSQGTDTTKWMLCVHGLTFDSSVVFKYPEYFKIKQEATNNIHCQPIADMDYIYYEPADDSEYDNSDTLEMPSGLKILLCNKKFSEVAKEAGFFEKNGFWYGDSIYIRFNKNESNKIYAADTIRFDGWSGIKAIYQTRIYLRGGGCFTAAGEDYRFILYKEIASHEYLFVIGYGFNFPGADKILKEICMSIKKT